MTWAHLGVVEEHGWWVLERRSTFWVVWHVYLLLINPGWVLLVVFLLAARLFTSNSTSCSIFSAMPTRDSLFRVESSQRLLRVMIRSLAVSRLVHLDVIESSSWYGIALDLSRLDHLLAWGASAMRHRLAHKLCGHYGLIWIWGERINGSVRAQPIVADLGLANWGSDETLLFR